MSLSDLPTIILEKIFFHLSPSNLENVRNAVDPDVSSHFSKTLTLVEKIKGDCPAVRRDFPVSVDTVLRLFPNKLRSHDDSVGLRKMALCLRAKVRDGKPKEKRFHDFFVAEKPPSGDEKYKCVFKMDPLSLDIAVYYPFHRVLSQVRIYSSQDAALLHSFDLQVLMFLSAFAFRGRRFLWLKHKINLRMALCCRDVVSESSNEREVILDGAFSLKSPSIPNPLLVSEDYVVVRDRTRIRVFSFPSLEFRYRKDMDNNNADLFENLLYLVEDKDVVVFDLKERTITRRVTWRSEGVAAGFFNWPYLWNKEDEFSCIANGPAEVVEWKKLERDEPPVRFRRCRGISELIVVEKNPGIFEIVDLTTGKVIRSLPLVLEFGQKIHYIFVHDFIFYFVLCFPATSRFSFCSFSFE